MPLSILLLLIILAILIFGFVKKIKPLIVIAIIALVVLISWWIMFMMVDNPENNQPVPEPIPMSENTNAQLANPASQNCIDVGGELIIRQKPNGGEYGVCIFEEGRECEEWAMMRGECPVGGLKLTGYDTEAQKYCAITGGEVDMDNATCLVDGDMVFGFDDYFNQE